jgi:hypothetical protein
LAKTESFLTGLLPRQCSLQIVPRPVLKMLQKILRTGRVVMYVVNAQLALNVVPLGSLMQVSVVYAMVLRFSVFFVRTASIASLRFITATWRQQKNPYEKLQSSH